MQRNCFWSTGNFSFIPTHSYCKAIHNSPTHLGKYTKWKLNIHKFVFVRMEKPFMKTSSQKDYIRTTITKNPVILRIIDNGHFCKSVRIFDKSAAPVYTSCRAERRKKPQSNLRENQSHHGRTQLS